jgi:hypothetical protein
VQIVFVEFRHAREDGRLGAVRVRVIGVSHAGEQREASTMRFELLQEARGFVIESGGRGDEMRVVGAERPVDEHHAARL